MTAFEIFASASVLVGSAFCVVGAIGLLRFPDFYCRTHAAGITDTLGAGLVLVGLCFIAGPSLVSLKLLTILCFLWLTSPAATHALSKAAYYRGVRVERAAPSEASGGPGGTEGPLPGGRLRPETQIKGDGSAD